jgi:hypothetical protein
MHTQKKLRSMQFAVTFTPATTKAEKKNKDTRDGATKRIGRDISYPKVRVVAAFRGNAASKCIF